MPAAKVSIVIPGRVEKFFQKTIDSALEKAESNIEIIAIVDGDDYDPPIQSNDKRVKIIRLPKSIGQREAYNLGVKKATGKYIMKIDAHCLLSQGFDVALKKVCKDKMVVLPQMRRLNPHIWEAKKGGETIFMNFGLDLYCHYWPEYGKRLKNFSDPVEVMTGQGSCWFTTKAWNNHIGLLNPEVGSWGNVGIEVALRTWLCGGTQVSTKSAWQAHYFRKDEGGFPYPLNGRNVAKAHQYTWKKYYFKDDAFKNQTRPFRWLIEKFAPIPQWEAYMVDSYKSPRAIVYYTDSKLEPKLAASVRKRIKRMAGLIPIYSVSQEPLKFGKNFCIGEKPCIYKNVYEALYEGVKRTPPGTIVFACEHDVFYHPSHFSFIPQVKGCLNFNENRFYYHLNCKTFYPTRGRRTLSQMVAYREDIMKHCEERLATAGDDITERWDDWEKRSELKCRNFRSDRPNVDILHGGNLTMRGHYKKDYIKGRTKGIKNLPGWGGYRHFQSISGYKKRPEPFEMKNPFEDKPENTPANNASTPIVLSKLNNGQVSPIRIPNFKRKPDLPALFKKCGFKIGAEIGVRRGEFSLTMLRTIKGLKLYCIDPWREYYETDNMKVTDGKAEQWYGDAKKNLAAFNPVLIRKASVDATADIEDFSLDFVYIDANHSFDFIMQDLIVWSKKVRRGGIISGHDYFRFRNAGVVPAVDVFTHQHSVHEWFISDEKEASFFFLKHW